MSSPGDQIVKVDNIFFKIKKQALSTQVENHFLLLHPEKGTCFLRIVAENNSIVICSKLTTQKGRKEQKKN